MAVMVKRRKKANRNSSVGNTDVKIVYRESVKPLSTTPLNMPNMAAPTHRVTARDKVVNSFATLACCQEVSFLMSAVPVQSPYPFYWSLPFEA